jgi:hypothetical protein
LWRERYKATCPILLTTEYITKTQIENFHTLRSPFSARAPAFVFTPLDGFMKSLCRSGQSRSKPYGARRYDAGAEEAVIMLDLAFVALGFALIGVMGLYAAGLRRL